MAVGVLLAAWPALAVAQETGSRELGTSDDLVKVVLLTLLGLGVVLTAAAFGYLYRRERGLDWDFQRPDPDGAHDGDHE